MGAEIGATDVLLSGMMNSMKKETSLGTGRQDVVDAADKIAEHLTW